MVLAVEVVPVVVVPVVVVPVVVPVVPVVLVLPRAPAPTLPTGTFKDAPGITMPSSGFGSTSGTWCELFAVSTKSASSGYSAPTAVRFAWNVASASWAVVGGRTRMEL